MAHFAEIDSNGIVQRVVVINDADLLDDNGYENELIGISVCKNIFGMHTDWVQTSYNCSFRGKYASQGDKYDQVANTFYNPIPPYLSWVIDKNCNWKPPIPYPSDGSTYNWDEITLSWVKSEFGDQ